MNTDTHQSSFWRSFWVLWFFIYVFRLAVLGALAYGESKSSLSYAFLPLVIFLWPEAMMFSRTAMEPLVPVVVYIALAMSIGSALFAVVVTGFRSYLMRIFKK